MAEQETPETYRTAERYGVDVDREREEILFGERLDWSEQSGGIARCGEGSYAERPGLTLNEVKTMLDLNYMDEEQQANARPTVGEFVEHGETLAERFGLDPDEKIRYISFVVSPYRDDARISIDGIYVTRDDRPAIAESELQAYFDHHFEHADERNYRGVVSAWWD